MSALAKARALVADPTFRSALVTGVSCGLAFYAGYRRGRDSMKHQATDALIEYLGTSRLRGNLIALDIEEEASGQPSPYVIKREEKAEETNSKPLGSKVYSIFDKEEETIVVDATALPYYITPEDFFSGDSGFEQRSATWYEYDLLLVDDLENAVIENYLERFGEIVFNDRPDPDVIYVQNGEIVFNDTPDPDPDVIYIRNPFESLEWEITRSSGSIDEDLRGIRPEDSSG